MWPSSSNADSQDSAENGIQKTSHEYGNVLMSSNKRLSRKCDNAIVLLDMVVAMSQAQTVGVT